MQTQYFVRTKGNRFRAFIYFAMKDYRSTAIRYGEISKSDVVSLADSVTFCNNERLKVHNSKQEAQDRLDLWRQRCVRDGYNDEISY